MILRNDMKLYKQLPNPPKSPIIGQFTVHNKVADFWTPDATKGSLVAELRFPEIVHASSEGIFLNGYEPAGVDKTGREITKYQEWWMLY